jgi:hypothetical protein
LALFSSETGSSPQVGWPTLPYSFGICGWLTVRPCGSTCIWLMTSGTRLLSTRYRAQQQTGTIFSFGGGLIIADRGGMVVAVVVLFNHHHHHLLIGPVPLIWSSWLADGKHPKAEPGASPSFISRSAKLQMKHGELSLPNDDMPTNQTSLLFAISIPSGNYHGSDACLNTRI